MGLIALIILAAVAAWIERLVFPARPTSDFLARFLLAWCGAAFGNLASYSLGYGELVAFDPRSMLFAILGIFLILLGSRLLQDAWARRRRHEP